MPVLTYILEIDRCPYCRIDKPNLATLIGPIKTQDHLGENVRHWKAYSCARCGGVVIAAANRDGGGVTEFYPSVGTLDENIPKRARNFLQQAIDSLHSPAGSVMLAASAVDAMLKARSYTEGSLYSRINCARDDNLITPDMAAWAHEVRLDANDQRHDDEESDLPTLEDAQRSVNFALALAEYLFVLPSRVRRGVGDKTPKKLG